MFIFNGIKPKSLNQRPNIMLRKGIHKNQNVVCIECAYNEQVMGVLHSTSTATWLIEDIKKGIRHSATRLRKLNKQTDSLQFNKIDS